jgi:hypothetical protein
MDWTIHEGESLLAGHYVFDGPDHRFVRALLAETCAAHDCKTLCALTRPFCVRHALQHRGVVVRFTGDTKRGFGVYADRDFKQGTLLVEYLGELVDDLVVADRYGDRTAAYVLRFLRSSLFVDGAAERSLGAMLNDGGAESNCVFLIAGSSDVDSLVSGRPGFWVAASKHIKKGDELKVSYGGVRCRWGLRLPRG